MRQPPTASYFPLDAGHRWVYDVKTEWENEIVEHEPLVLSTLGRETVGEHATWRRRSDGTGIFRVASKSDLDAEPVPDPAPRYVLKMPLATGSS